VSPTRIISPPLCAKIYGVLCGKCALVTDSFLTGQTWICQYCGHTADVAEIKAEYKARMKGAK